MDFTDLEALLGESLPSEGYRDVWVVVTSPRSGSLLGYARELANSLGAYVCAIASGHGAVAAEECIALGADRVYQLPDGRGFDSVDRLLAAFGGTAPEFVFFEAGQAALAGRLAARLNCGLVTDCAGFRLDESRRRLIATHPVYDGEYLLDVEITSGTQVFTLQLDRLPRPMRDPSRLGEITTVEPPPDDLSPARAVNVEGPADFHLPPPPLSKARRIVAVGRGLRDEGLVETARLIASCLGAAFAGDRSAADSGWVDEAHLVGVTGHEVAPDGYLAIGIWGDTFHNAAIEGARRIIAIHPDASAPILKLADVAVVADPKELLPKLLAQLS